MTRRGLPANVAASVRARLAALATGDNIQLTMTRYALERFLYRLSVSDYAELFILKGAMLFAAWGPPLWRPTRDLDLLGHGEHSATEVARIFAEIAAIAPDREDGVVFETSAMRAQDVREADDYSGVCLSFTADIGGAKLPVQIDFGFGDAVTPGPVLLDYPSLLDFPRPRLRAYPVETVIAEKFRAVVHFGLANTRMKDLYDLWPISRRFELAGATVSAAMKATFARRGTPLPSSLPAGLSERFADDARKQNLWRVFLERMAATASAPNPPATVRCLQGFCVPPAAAALDGGTFSRVWRPGEDWRDC
jgi:predicted nucleotidyltransferase component of viral defense system